MNKLISSILAVVAGLVVLLIAGIGRNSNMYVSFMIICSAAVLGFLSWIVYDPSNAVEELGEVLVRLIFFFDRVGNFIKGYIKGCKKYGYLFMFSKLLQYIFRDRSEIKEGGE